METTGKIHKNTILRAQRIAQLAIPHYEEGCQAKCWRAVWKHHVYPVYPMCYNTFLKYLHISKMDFSANSREEPEQKSLFD